MIFESNKQTNGNINEKINFINNLIDNLEDDKDNNETQPEQYFKSKQRLMEYPRKSNYNLPKYKNISLPFQNRVEISFDKLNENYQTKQTTKHNKTNFMSTSLFNRINNFNKNNVFLSNKTFRSSLHVLEYNNNNSNSKYIAKPPQHINTNIEEHQQHPNYDMSYTLSNDMV